MNIFCCRNIVLYICIKFVIITKDSLHIAILKRTFKVDQVISILNLRNFYKSFEPNITDTTLNWRIYTLIQLGILTRIGRGKYIIGRKNNFIPEISKKMKSIHKKLKPNFPFLDICLWNTSAFNEFMRHQPGRFYIMVEVDRDAMESVFFFLKDNKYHAFLAPDPEIIYHYFPDEKEVIIVKSLVTEAPTQVLSNITTITIEKMLVDLFCDPVNFNAQQDLEKDRIFKEAIEKYTVNENSMLRYADRRSKKKEFDEYLNKVSKFRQQ